MEPVTYRIERGVGIITLNRPERLNASNGAMSRSLNDHMVAAAANPDVRVILLKGAGKAFCAGADMQVLKEHETAPGSAKTGSNGLRYDGMMRVEKPVVAAVHGACAGVGLAMACSADIRIASENALFVAPFSQLGLCAEAGLAWHLTRIMGRANALEMLLSARRIGAEEAYEKGLVALVYPDEFFENSALNYAFDMASSGAPSSFAHNKSQIMAVDNLNFDHARLEAEILTKQTLHAVEFKTAIKARQSKEKPNFVGLSVPFTPPITQP